MDFLATVRIVEIVRKNKEKKMIKKSIDKQVIKFLKEFEKLDTIEAIGVMRLLNIKLVTRKEGQEEVEVKNEEQIIEELIRVFRNSTKAKRKYILSIIKEANKEVW